jgi:hypothetical protein
MNNGGSTMLHEYLSKCSLVVPLPRRKDKSSSATSSEGHVLARDFMPSPYKLGVGAMWTEKSSEFENDKNYDWESIKNTWEGGWRRSDKWSDEGVVLLEKSPPNVIRANLLQDNFENSYFILMVRNPYAVSEGIRRRWGYSIQRAAEHWVRATSKQIRNLETLNRCIFIKYESLCSNPKKEASKVRAFMPELHDLSFNLDISGTHAIGNMNKKKMGLNDFNKRQIGNLSKSDLFKISRVLLRNKGVVRYFGYGIKL